MRRPGFFGLARKERLFDKPKIASEFSCLAPPYPAERRFAQRGMTYFSEWFPSSGHESVPLPAIEVYSDGDSSSDDYGCEIWVPIAKLNP
jgi:hypothetical protein